MVLVSHISLGTSDFGEIYPKASRWTTVERAIAIQGDILVTVKGAGVGKTNILSLDKVAIGRQLMAIRANYIFSEFIYLLIQARRDYLFECSLGTTVPGIGREDILKMQCLLPPLAEQKRIVEKVDELMGLCDRYESAKQARDNLRQKLRESAIASLMNAETDRDLDATWAFVRDNWHNLSQHPEDVGELREVTLQLAVRGKLVSQNFNDEPASALLERVQIEKQSLLEAETIKKYASLSPTLKDEKLFLLPANWEWVRGQDISIFVTSGSRGWAKYYSSSGAIFIRIGNLDYGKIELDLESIQFVKPPEGAEGTRTRVSCNDILISITGDTGMIGLVRSEMPEAYINQHIALLRPVRCIYAEYIARFLTSNFALKQLKGAQRGIKNSLGLEDIRNLVISLPPLAEQKRIVAKVDELMQLCDRLETSLRESQQRAESLAASAVSHLTI
uniref:Restriction endonuclease subunit S n=1 Tax=Desertifilum tharense IPPAS B-1220 TaxID=1781255 RepID=A0ACD5GYN9_9CYAN